IAQWAANWIVNNELRYAPSIKDFEKRVSVQNTFVLFQRIESANVTATAAKSLLDDVFSKGANPDSIFVTSGSAISDMRTLLSYVRDVIEENPGPVSQYRG